MIAQQDWQHSRQFDKNDVEIKATKPAYRGYFSVTEYQYRHALYQGGLSDWCQREVFERGNSVGVLLYDPHAQEVVMVEQFRIGALADPRTPWLLEIVAGSIDNGDNPEQTALREVYEEAGIELDSLTFIMDYWVSPGGATEQMTLYCAQVDANLASGYHGLDHEHEDIRVVRLSFKKALQLLAEGVINSGPAIITLQWLALNKAQLDQCWLEK